MDIHNYKKRVESEISYNSVQTYLFQVFEKFVV